MLLEDVFGAAMEDWQREKNLREKNQVLNSADADADYSKVLPSHLRRALEYPSLEENFLSMESGATIGSLGLLGSLKLHVHVSREGEAAIAAATFLEVPEVPWGASLESLGVQENSPFCDHGLSLFVTASLLSSALPHACHALQYLLSDVVNVCGFIRYALGAATCISDCQ